jgi:hypothetical protein
MGETEAIRVEFGLESGFMHHVAHNVMGNQQGIEFLHDAQRLQATQRAASQALAGVDFIDHQLNLPAFVVSTRQLQRRTCLMIQQRGHQTMSLTILLRADQPSEIRVEAAGYQPWALAIRGGRKDKRMEGPVRMVPVEPKA